jgi:hypothetical protein
MTANPGRTITTYSLESLTDISYQPSFTIKNIMTAFCKSGIRPFSRLAIND